jgi:DNA-binding MarR family transcriptional regulator
VGCRGEGQRSPRPPRVTWTPEFPWRPFAVPRLASSELVSWTTAATPALQPGTTFRLNARLLEAAQVLAANGGLTAAWWQVLGGIVDQPRTVAEIGRRMGMTLQGVQRVADLLVAHHLAEYRPNPAHRRAKLLACTEAGDWAIRRISFVAHPFSNRIGAQLATDELRNTLMTMRHLVALLEADQLPPND